MKKSDKTRVLIVEDEPLIALGLDDLLVDSGYEVAGVAGKLRDALAIVELGGFDAAILDANLAGVSAGPVGAALTARGLPYLVLSGYSSKQQVGAFPGAARFLQKPCVPEHLIDALNKILPPSAENAR